MAEKWKKIKFYFLIALILMSAVSSFVLYSKGYSFSEIANEVGEYKHSPVIYILLFFVSAFFPIPFLTFLGAYIFPFWEVLIYSVAGNMASATIVFYVVRWLGRDYIKIYEKNNKKAKELNLKIKKNAFRDIVLLRFFFIIPPEAVNILGGISGMRFKEYFNASLLGIIPLSFASILLVKSEIEKNLIFFIISSAIFAIMLIIPLIYISGLRKFFQKKWGGFIKR